MEPIESSVRKGPQNHVSSSMDERPHNLHNHDEWWTELLMEPTLRCVTQDATRAWRPRLRYRVYASSQNHVFWYTLQLCIKRTRALNTHPRDKTRLFCFLHLHLHFTCAFAFGSNELLGERLAQFVVGREDVGSILALCTSWCEKQRENT